MANVSSSYTPTSRNCQHSADSPAPSPSLPEKLREHGIAAVHPRPFCANEDSHIIGRFDSAYAFATFPKLEIQPPHVYASIVLDCDTPSDSGWPGGKPSIPPSWMVVNTRPGTPERRPGGIHAVYALEVPVARHNVAHRLPLAYLAHIADRLAYHLSADPGYQGTDYPQSYQSRPGVLHPLGPNVPVHPAGARQAPTKRKAAEAPVDGHRAQQRPIRNHGVRSVPAKVG